MNISEIYQQRIIETAIALDRSLYNKKIFHHTPFTKHLEIVFNLIGFAAGIFFFRLAPCRSANQFSRWAAACKSGWRKPPFSETDLNHIEIAKNLIAESKATTGNAPAALFLATHPETSSSSAHLLGEILSHAIQAGELLYPRSKFKLVQAIDPFALDTLPQFLGAIYAGLMTSGHIGVDRLPSKRTAMQRLLFKNNHYQRSFFNLILNLKSDTIVFAALGGGVAHNARVFYTVNEFAQRIFALVKPKNQTKRAIEEKMIAMLTRKERFCACATGELSIDEEKDLLLFLSECGLTGARAQGQINEFREELKSCTPFRLRLFHVLFHRLCSRGVPTLLMPIRHSKEGEILLGGPVLITGYDRQKRIVRFLANENDPKALPAGEFASQFVKANLSV